MTKKLNLYFETDEENKNFSLESISILCLLNYCELEAKHLNLFLCQNGSLNHKIQLRLKEIYESHFIFLTLKESFELKDVKQIPIYLQNINDLNKNFKNVSLPCLKISDSNEEDDEPIVYSGVATVYRAIVNYAIKTKQDKRFKNLLVRKNKNYRFRLYLF